MSVTGNGAAVAELMTTSQVAEYLGVSSNSYAYVVLRRAGIDPVSRALGQGGENQYRAVDVKRKLAPGKRPGRGYRTDVHLNRPSSQAKYRKKEEPD